MNRRYSFYNWEQSKVKIMNVLCETIVCRAKENTDARLERMIKTRIEFSKRSDFALNSWYGRSQSDELLFMIQTTFANLESYHELKSSIQEKLDSKDGGLEACFSGPPLVGMFEIDENMIESG